MELTSNCIETIFLVRNFGNTVLHECLRSIWLGLNAGLRRERRVTQPKKVRSSTNPFRLLVTSSKQIHVPYRNSTLTKLLSDSLGGNSKTIMIAACGPAASNIEETTSTMRFAARVKAVKNKPKINEDPKDAKMREMGDEISKLRTMNAELKLLSANGGVDPSKLATANLKGIAGQMKYFMAKKSLRKERR